MPHRKTQWHYKAWFADTRPLEVLSALCAFFFSVSVALNGFEDLRTYHVMDNLAPGLVWGLAFAVCCGLQFIGLLSNETRLRAWGAGYAAPLWGVTSVSVWASWPLAPHAGIYMALALASLWVLQRGLTDND